MRARPMIQRKEAIRLREEEGLTYQAIAEELNIPRDTVKSWYRRNYMKENGKPIGEDSRRGTEKHPFFEKNNKVLNERDYKKRIKQLEMEVELLRDFLSVVERRSIKK